MTTRHQISVTVNGVNYQREVDARLTLADFVRHDLSLGGTHVGCEHGVCGACTILVNGASMRSCLMLAVQADGAELTTVEGLSRNGELHPVQQAFIDRHGLQCGFCTPGFLISTAELLQGNPNPSDDEIADALGGHLCRCTGYQSILESVQLAAQMMREGTIVDAASPAEA
ncbi:MAG: (2Fe-2S)-binding protein [Halioglobus sp.]|nr:(2Fe-2S)-binding protein [Halioglobus sp.]